MKEEHGKMSLVMMRDIQRRSRELETLLAKSRSLMLPTVPSAVITLSFILLLQSLGETGGDMNTMVKVAQPLLILAIMFSLATWLCSQEWGSEVVAASSASRRALAVIEGSVSQQPFSAINLDEFEVPVLVHGRDFNFRYWLLVIIRLTYLFCFLLGCIFTGVSILRSPRPQYWLLLGAALSWSLIFHSYRAYRSYCSSLTLILASNAGTSQSPRIGQVYHRGVPISQELLGESK